MGNVIMAMSKAEKPLNEADDIKALVVLRGIQMVCNIGVHNIIIEGDSLWTINALNSSTPNLSRQGHLFEEVIDMMKLFNDCQAVHVGRSGNVVAHKLAIHAQFTDSM
ncbi:hypothetical protein AAC387_Pa02g4685 [Persea americana]